MAGNRAQETEREILRVRESLEMLLPEYALLEHLGQGGFAHVFRARRLEDGRDVAIKIADAPTDAIRLRFRQEVEALKQLGPPHTPTLVDARLDSSNAAPYFMMDFIDKPRLSRLLDENSGPWPIAPALRCIRQILVSLAAVHDRKLVHRDLKPSNILIDRFFRRRSDGDKDGRTGAFEPRSLPDFAPSADANLGPDEMLEPAYLIDFGLVGAAQTEAQQGITEAGQAPGTVLYMAPEQFQGVDTRNTATDVYAIGVIFYRLLTGRLPFVGTVPQIAWGHCMRRPPRPSSLAPMPAVIEQIVLDCMAKKGHHRPANARELLDRLPTRVPMQGPMQVPMQGPMQREDSGLRRASESAAPKVSGKRQAPMRRLTAVLYIAGKRLLAVHKTVEKHGGVAVHLTGGLSVFAFPLIHASERSPLDDAMTSAIIALEQGARAALVHVAMVRVLKRKKGGFSYVSNAFIRGTIVDAAREHTGLLISTEARELIRDSTIVMKELTTRSKIFAATTLTTQADPLHQDSGDMQLKPAFGRDELLAQLAGQAASTIHERRPFLCTITGRPGIGKTHLALTLSRRIHESLPETEVLELQSSNANVGDQQLFRDFLRTVMGFGARPNLDAVEDAVGIALEGALWAAAALAFGWDTPDSENVRKFAAVPGALQSAARKLGGEALLARARRERGGLVVIADDIARESTHTQDALEYAADFAGEAPLWLCVLTREQLFEARPQWGQGANSSRHELEALSRADAAALCRHCLQPASDVPQAAVDILVEMTQGVPLLITELIRTVRRDGILRRASSADSWYLAVDELEQRRTTKIVDWLVAREFAALHPDLAAQAGLAALMLPGFHIDEFAGILERLESAGKGVNFPLDPTMALPELVRVRLLAERHGGYHFRNELMRATVAASVDAHLRKEVHLHAYTFYESLAERGRDVLRQLAHHAEGGGHIEAAIEHIRSITEDALVGHHYLRAELQCSKVIALVVPDPSSAVSSEGPQGGQAVLGNEVRAWALRRRGLARYRMGRLEDSVEDFEKALSEAETGPEVVDTLLDLATALDWLGRFERSAQLVEDAHRSAGPDPQPRLQARLAMGRGRSAWRGSQLAMAIPELELGARLAQTLGHDSHETLVACWLMLLVCLPEQGQHARARRIGTELLSLCTERGDRFHLAAALSNRRHVLMAQGQVRQVIADLEQSAGIARELGMISMEVAMFVNLGELWLQQGNVEKATFYADKAMAWERKNRAYVAPYGTVLAARIAAYLNDAARARTLLEECGELPGEEHALRVAVLLFIDDVLEHAEWSTLEVDDNLPFTVRAEVMDLHARTAIRAGRREEAIASLENAKTLLREALQPNWHRLDQTASLLLTNIS